jgi:hypothetical protein
MQSNYVEHLAGGKLGGSALIHDLVFHPGARLYH